MKSDTAGSLAGTVELSGARQKTAQRINCFHCGLPARDTRYSVVIDGEPRPMCCPGCQAVASAIVAGDLQQFYRYRARDSERPEESDATAFAAFDLPEVQADIVRGQADGSAAVDLAITGMTCAACAWLIEQHVGRLPGVVQVGVNVSRHRARVVWDPEKTTLSALLASFVAIGYRASPLGETNGLDELAAEQRRHLLRLGVAGIGMMQVGMLAVALYAGAIQGMDAHWGQLLRWASLLVASPVVFYSARPFFAGALRSLRVWHLTMDVPVALAIGIAYASSAWATISGGGEVYFDAVSMFTFFLLLGRFLELRVRYRNELRMGEVQQKLPLTALRVAGEGHELVPVKSLRVGDQVRVGEGEYLPVDGEVIEGESRVVEAMLTGEQAPVLKKPGAEVYAATLNTRNGLLVRVTAVGAGTRLAAVVATMDRALTEKPPQVAMADRLAGLFVGVVLCVALLVFAFWWQYRPDDALWVTLSVLVVTCPCALSLATPAALASATYFLRRRGLLVRRGHTLQALASIDRVIFDKTGTLTHGELSIAEVQCCAHAAPVDRARALALAAALERACRHPVARALATHDTGIRAGQVDYQPGGGVSGIIHGERLALGSASYVGQTLGCVIAEPQHAMKAVEGFYYQRVVLADARGALAWIVLADGLRPGVRGALECISRLGLEIELLSGDQSSAVGRLAGELGIAQWRAACSPEQKLARVRKLQARGEAVLMVGDGINDVPVLSGADVAVAVDQSTDFTRQAADAVLLHGDLAVLAESIRHARRAARVIRQNLGWALFYNVAALPLAAMGLVPPWAAAIGMSASSVLVVLNALRLQRPVAPGRARVTG